ncbi:hypothetical protein IH799_05025, partial [candidate division KSB1 bacterium]|nr:hypothetical protein [candidate division KSB1 bacterium]
MLNKNFFIGLLVILICTVSIAVNYSDLFTKEDVKKITDEIEKARFPYAKELERLRQEHQFRLAAIDRRLEVHQEAFALWNQLLHTADTDAGWETALECQVWWYNHCLYLEPGAREAFRRAYMA